MVNPQKILNRQGQELAEQLFDQHVEAAQSGQDNFLIGAVLTRHAKELASGIQDSESALAFIMNFEHTYEERGDQFTHAMLLALREELQETNIPLDDWMDGFRGNHHPSLLLRAAAGDVAALVELRTNCALFPII